MRAALGPEVGGSRPLLHALVIVGQTAPNTIRQKWVYEHLAFVSDSLSPRRLASLFVPETEQTLDLGSARISSRFPSTNFMWEKKPSLAQYDELSLLWPSAIYTPSLADKQNMNQSSYLVGAGNSPSFPTFGAAFNAFFYGKFAISGTGNPSLGEVSVRLVDQRARIRRVKISPLSLDIWIGGRSLTDCYLELNGLEYRYVIPVAKPGRVSLPLPAGLPSDAWLWLKSGTEWLDFRALNNWGGHRSPDIEVDVPADPVADLTRLITQGEGLHLEYKSKLPDTRDEKRHVFKTIVAYANGKGGSVIFGIDDDGQACGLMDGLEQARTRLNDLLRDLISPAPETRIETHRHEGRNILVLYVEPSNGVLHALVLNSNKPEYYVRRDGTTYYAQPDEIAAIVRQADAAYNHKTSFRTW